MVVVLVDFIRGWPDHICMSLHLCTDPREACLLISGNRSPILTGGYVIDHPGSQNHLLDLVALQHSVLILQLKMYSLYRDVLVSHRSVVTRIAKNK